MNRLQNKVAIITGGNSGIGYATAQRFVEEGATVYITGRDANRLEAAKVKLDGKVTAIRADAASPSEMRETFDHIRMAHGKLDILFLNAGIAPVASIESITDKLYDEIFATNVKGVFFAVQHALGILSSGSSVIINSSTVNAKGMPGFVAYAATKAAVRSFARGMSAELATKGIRVNTVSPGPIDTPLYGKTGLTEQQNKQARENITRLVPAGRFGTDLEIADAVVYLASDESRYVVGSDLYVDGGMSQI